LLGERNSVTATFAEELKQHSIKTWQEILDHRFIKELSKNTLPMNKFVFYLKQDHYFLEGFSKFLDSAKLKTNDNKMKEWLERLHFSTVNLEMKMQRDLLYSIGVASLPPQLPIDLASIIPSKTTLDYISYLEGVLSVGKCCEIVSVMAPCPWTYLEISQKLSRVNIKNKAYKNWVQFYSSDESYKQVAEIQHVLNLLSEEEDQQYRQKMINHFVNACNYEFRFWEMAYNLGG
jgi:thiaminase (transcriptional activator TenA)